MKFQSLCALSAVLALLAVAAAPPAAAASSTKVQCAGLWYSVDTGEHELDPVMAVQETDCFAFVGVSAGKVAGVLVENACTPTATGRTCTLTACHYSAGVLAPDCTEFFRHDYALPA